MVARETVAHVSQELMVVALSQKHNTTPKVYHLEFSYQKIRHKTHALANHGHVIHQ